MENETFKCDYCKKEKSTFPFKSNKLHAGKPVCTVCKHLFLVHDVEVIQKHGLKIKGIKGS